jgi:hypothetical protein
MSPARASRGATIVARIAQWPEVIMMAVIRIGECRWTAA